MRRLLCLFLILVAGCAAPSRESLSSFREGLSAVQKESREVFLDVNRTARKAQISRVGTLTMLKESDVSPALDPASLAQWNRALEALSAYASALEILADPKSGDGVEESVGKLGRRIEAMGPGTDELTKAVAGLGGVLTRSVAGHAAREAMLDADPHVRDVLTRMADMIGDGPEAGGVRTTVWAAWTLFADEARKGFPESASHEKHVIAQTYASRLESRDEADAALAAVRRALLDLADAHTAASQGRTIDAERMVAFLRKQVAHAAKIFKDTGGDK